MSLMEDLTALGFRPMIRTLDDGDFRLQNDSDGLGDYVKEWKSPKACPFPKLQRPPRK